MTVPNLTTQPLSILGQLLPEFITEDNFSKVYIALALHCLIGLAAGAIATGKGRRPIVWFPVGIIMGTPAFILALLMRSPHSD